MRSSRRDDRYSSRHANPIRFRRASHNRPPPRTRPHRPVRVNTTAAAPPGARPAAFGRSRARPTPDPRLAATEAANPPSTRVFDHASTDLASSVRRGDRPARGRWDRVRPAPNRGPAAGPARRADPGGDPGRDAGPTGRPVGPGRRGRDPGQPRPGRGGLRPGRAAGGGAAGLGTAAQGPPGLLHERPGHPDPARQRGERVRVVQAGRGVRVRPVQVVLRPVRPTGAAGLRRHGQGLRSLRRPGQRLRPLRRPGSLPSGTLPAPVWRSPPDPCCTPRGHRCWRRQRCAAWTSGVSDAHRR